MSRGSPKITFRLPANLKALLERTAKSRGLSVSDILRQCIEHWNGPVDQPKDP